MVILPPLDRDQFIAVHAELIRLEEGACPRGAWQHENYGIGYVVADHPLRPYCRPDDDAPILHSLPGEVIGPGHNSFTETPSGQEYIVYHGWDTAMRARQLRIDRLEWDSPHPVVLGPTTTPQPLA